ncbi:hypothetical protein KSC_044150 [Ktedonobacter sp. SOSP1-52]|nr:hypothetical protein KSC_044150 [Ktedonobacter sp. SOSP1-52]
MQKRIHSVNRKRTRPPAIDPQIQLKWGLALLGTERATQYLTWMQARLKHNYH